MRGPERQQRYDTALTLFAEPSRPSEGGWRISLLRRYLLAARDKLSTTHMCGSG